MSETVEIHTGKAHISHLKKDLRYQKQSILRREQTWL